MPPRHTRVAIYPKDIELITGRRPRTAQNILLQIRRHYKKRRRSPVTIHEFCEFMQLKEEFVREILADA